MQAVRSEPWRFSEHDHRTVGMAHDFFRGRSKELLEATHRAVAAQKHVFRVHILGRSADHAPRLAHANEDRIDVFFWGLVGKGEKILMRVPCLFGHLRTGLYARKREPVVRNHDVQKDHFGPGSLGKISGLEEDEGRQAGVVEAYEDPFHGTYLTRLALV